MTAGAEPDGGSATVEFALVIPAIVALLAAVLSVGQWAAAQSRAETAAATAARVAIVDTEAAAQAAVEHIAGRGAQATVSRANGWITVVVDARAAWGLPVSATAVARDQE